MAVLAQDPETPELPGDVAQAAIDEGAGEDDGEYEELDPKDGGALVKKRPAAACHEEGEAEELGDDEEAFDELERELRALWGKAAGDKAAARDDYTARVDRLKEKLSGLRGGGAAAGVASAGGPSKK